MSKVRVHNFSISLDGFGAGADQSLDDPLGVGGEQLHEWFINTATFDKMYASGGTDTGLNDEFARRGDEGIGATIMGRNMFGPVRGPWPDDKWTGWWGDEPPYHHPVFVLTHHERASIPMKGGTTFHFVTGGIHEALERALDAANGQDVRLGGGVSTIQQYIRAGLVDELHVAVAPILLGRGERLFDNLGDTPGLECVELVSAPSAVHIRLVRTGGGRDGQLG